MKLINYSNYHSFLKSRSIVGKFYRKFWLYPNLCKFLKGKTLDIGSGIGDFVEFRKNTIGVDINPDNVKWCQEKNLDVRLMDLNILPFHDLEFDSVNLDNVLEHIEDPTLLLNEIDRVLNNNGILQVGVPGILGFANAPDHEIFYSKTDLIHLFTTRGYELIKLYDMPFKFQWLDKRLHQYCYYGVFRKRN